jgi:hypothetical protein
MLVRLTSGSAAISTARRRYGQRGETRRAVVVSIPLKHYPQLPVAPLAGKVVLDTTNYYPDRDGSIPELDAEKITSSELIQQHLPESKIVKAFNNIWVNHLLALARPTGAPDRSVLPIAGDTAEATTKRARSAIFMTSVSQSSSSVVLGTPWVKATCPGRFTA